MIHYNRLLIFSLILCFCIFLGIELATKGMNEIQGPSVRADKRTDNTVKSAPPEVEGKPRMTEEEIREDERKKVLRALLDGQFDQKGTPRKEAGKDKETPAGSKASPPLEGKKTGGMNQVGNHIGDMLKNVAQKGISSVVSLFDSIFR
ncbi:hypothetical protein ERICIV_03132 [Paenibacillus larvae subsp. larvae]|uniref:Uncharacterized protein n=2 Tax=Paenibacillus larvae subsp. larvae TaxID=147375 RepID=V9W9I7_9BACL|nr:hypothetical protein [Paenibacillus larvae]AHD06360.1 hypothetical protein ERIC2_c25710 [Paenibacillus larvae subsp. larvae DSM 25430]AQZ45392.1 hypothetical protein B5S25_01080 [Paenibacillus larvae subsp. pulvifaciens]AVF27348.1 hypothetical protein ERICIII_03229 [Paenibacillus larvae subsp. larvae]AVF32011.1 hypothetical protein ERICIV_03132 [Paenibacillus larvae subsp. larvae]AVG12901.1 hypothetical protein ERICII_02546 [Paenibacillus larvae subsp. larvae DSM 25430]